MTILPMFAQRRRTRVGAFLLGVIAAAAVTVHAADAFVRPVASMSLSTAALLLKLPASFGTEVS